MSLVIGARLGNYEIVGFIGAGGMGEVCRARDTRLGREVAIKIIAPHIAGDRDSVVRFEREARALAALNHPNIAGIYDVIDYAGQPALVLELVDGESLADRLSRGPIPQSEAIECARQIADALDTAHEAGIIHRDLKPANIKVAADGRVKVLDFGLAKAVAAAAGESVESDVANSPTVAVHGTRAGVILGTAAYMSPEQARGKRVDKRTDIWAFGCVLFEMLTGRQAFGGETSSDVIAAIIGRAPELSALPPTTPPWLRRVVERCLEKDVRRRARDIADVRADLDLVESKPAATGNRSRAVLAALVIIAAVASALLAWTTIWRRVPPLPADPVEFTFLAPEGHAISGRPTPSPDGRQVAFVARDQRNVTSIWLRPIDASTSRRLEQTEGTGDVVSWSPDSRALAFSVGGSWKRINIDGGPAVTIVVNGMANLGTSWGVGDVLLVAPSNRTALARVPVSGGSLQPVTTLDTDKENSHRWPQLLPDGRHFLFTARSDSPERLGIKVGSLDSGEVRLLVNTASQGVYTEPGWLLFMTPDSVLMAQPLAASTWTLNGAPKPVAGGVRYNGPSFNGAFGASLDGRVLTYLPAARAAATIAWFDRSGKPMGRVAEERSYRGLRASPTGRAIAVEVVDDRYGTRDIWVLDTATQTVSRLTSHAATDWRPVFSPDGLSVAFASDRAGRSTVFRTPAGGGAETALYRNDDGGVFPADWSRDGKHLLVTVDDAEGRTRQMAIVAADGGSPTTLIEGEALAPRFSPDGQRIAFWSRQTGGPEVYVMTIANRQRVRVSTGGGSNPTWGPDGRELYFQSPRNEIMLARLESGGTNVAANPEPLFQPCVTIDRSFGASPAEQGYDVSADGTQFIVNCDPPDAQPSAVTVVINWQSKLR